MVKVVWSRFQQCFDPLQCCLLKGTLKRDFSDIYLTTHFESVISEIHQVWVSHFFWKWKFNVKFQKCISQREIFSKSIAFAVINKYGKGSAFRFCHCLAPLTILLSKSLVKWEFLDIYLTTFFGVRNFEKKVSYKAHLFLENI